MKKNNRPTYPLFALGLLPVLLFLLILAPGVSAIAAPEPTYDTAVVDGSSGEWDLNADFFADMHEAGKAEKTVFSKLYMRYDCTIGTAYVLVLLENGHTLDLSANDNFVKFGTNDKRVDGNDNADGIPPDFAYIGTSGWEASFALAQGSYSNLNVHALVDGGKTSAVIGRAIPLTVDCLGSIGDYVWHDENGNTIQDEDPAVEGLPNIAMRLLRETAPNTFELVDTQTTGANGAYLFTGLPVGNYVVEVNNPDIQAAFPGGWISTTNNDPYPPPPGTTYALAHGEDHLEADFGYDDLGDLVALGDWVWYDEDGQGDQNESADHGLPCVTIWLYDKDNNLVGQTNTDTWGYYYFGGMATSPLYSTEVDATDVDIDNFIANFNGDPDPATCNTVAEFAPTDNQAGAGEVVDADSTTPTALTTTILNTAGTTDLGLDYAFNAPTALSLVSLGPDLQTMAPSLWALSALLFLALTSAGVLFYARAKKR